MKEPLWWIWLTTFTRLIVSGCDYFGVPRLSPTAALFVAGVVRDACARIRRTDLEAL